MTVRHCIIHLLICLFVYLFIPASAGADTLQQARDVLSTSLPGGKSVHTITFTTVNPVNPGGKIVILFPPIAPGDSYKSGTASASTFMLNSITDNYIKIFGLSGKGTFTGTYKNPTGIDPSVGIILTLTDTTAIPANSGVTVLLGCTSANQANTICTTIAPIIFNPLLLSGGVWVVRVKTQDTNANTIDTTRLRVDTNPGIGIAAHIEQNFMMSIQGIANSIQIQKNNSKCIDNTDITNSGSTTTSRTVGLGSIPIDNVTIAAQDITIGTNGTSGYILIATASSSLRSSETGFSFTTSLLPQPFTIGKNFFGIHPCGADVDAVIWGSKTTATGANRYAWASNGRDTLRLASHTTSRTLTKTTVEYAATTDNSVPAGTYTTSIMYTAMPIF